MVLCEDCPDSATAHVIAKRLNDALSAPVSLDGRTVYTSSSIGGLLPGELPVSAEEVMRDADAAMHAVKRRGKARCLTSAPKPLAPALDLRDPVAHEPSADGTISPVSSQKTDELVPYCSRSPSSTSPI
jgi:Diguanylate cyclase, GGDEF domain